MDDYPDHYAHHNTPFIVLSGLESSEDAPPAPVQNLFFQPGSPSVSCECPLVTGERAAQLLQEFRSAEKRPAPARAKDGPMLFKMASVGREYPLHSRKANPPSLHDTTSPPGSPTVQTPQLWVLHSPISPLSPSSPLYPDGLMLPSWVAKHQYHIPAVFISFFEFTSDPSRNSLDDNQLKTAINNMRTAFQRAEYKTRFIAVLLSNKTILEAPDIEERLANIRRATNLDLKTSLLFVPPNTSRVEIAVFVSSLLSTLQPVCVEYYRELTKHARRKKNRGTLPPPTVPPTRGTSQALSSLGWSVRYDFKLGVFAEFRQEMDAAGRHYSAAFESLLGSDGTFESTASWSPRWNEARELADAIALRIIRCLLWNSLTTTAVQSWINYRDRIREIVDRRGKGSANYGWEAWESRWTKIMAELMQRAELPIFTVPESGPEGLSRELAFFSAPEKLVPVGERLPPWHLLHHPGYWLRIAAKHAINRRRLAREIPEENRTPPGESPAHVVASSFNQYDTFMCPEPHFENPLPGHEGYDHHHDIVELMNQAINEFHARGQHRFVDMLQLELGKELMREANYPGALNVLKPLWEGMSWRLEGWWNLIYEVNVALHQCARRVQDVESIVITQWELTNRAVPRAPGLEYDFMRCADSLASEEAPDVKPQIVLKSGNTLSFLSCTCNFAAAEGHVGEPHRVQLTIISSAHSESLPVVASSITVQFEGNLRQIRLQHFAKDLGSSSAKNSTVEDVILRESDDSTNTSLTFMGDADLTFYPGQTKAFTLPIMFRDAGDVAAISITTVIDTPEFNLSCRTIIAASTDPPFWWVAGPRGLRPKRIGRETATSAIVLPKPPKMEINLPNLETQYYTDEAVALDIELENLEDEETEAKIEIRFLSPNSEVPEFFWASGSTVEGSETSEPQESSPIDLPGHSFGRLAPEEKRKQCIKFHSPPLPSEFIVEIKVLYHLLSDRDTPISKTTATGLSFIGPFEANYEFLPRVHSAPWPSFFTIQPHQPQQSPISAATSSPTPGGITQSWSLAARIVSFALSPLTITHAELTLLTITGGARSIITKEAHPESTSVAPTDLQERGFGVEVAKLSLEDRRATTLDLSLQIRWHRVDSSITNTTSLAIPRLLVPNSEPRVLCTATPHPSLAHVVTLFYMLENPTHHFLTFELTMESSEDFAFSGAKLRTVNLLPCSRQSVEYRILPLVRAQWIAPQLKVMDKYFGKTLRVVAADVGAVGRGLVRMGRKGVEVWVDADEDGEA